MKLTNRSNAAKLFGLMAAPLILFMLHSDVQAATTPGHWQIKTQKTRLQPKQFSSFAQLKNVLLTKSAHDNATIQVHAFTTANLAAVSADLAANPTYSQTNVQVAGVDEGDLLKTDGRYVYSVQDGQLRIIQAYPANSMAIVASLKFDSAFSPVELYVQNDQLVVVGSRWNVTVGPALPANGQPRIAIWPGFGEAYTTARVYNIADRANPIMQREIEFSGSYLASRRVGDSVYLIGKKYPSYYLAFKKPKMTPDNTLPHISDSAVNAGKDSVLPLSNLFYFPGFIEPDYVVVTAFNLKKLDQPADVKAYLGGGEVTYASAKNLYLSAADYNVGPSSQKNQVTQVTHLYKFALNEGSINFNAVGEVPGTVLNSFSMDEYNGYFRIATTVNRFDWWQFAQNTAQGWNNVYTLDTDMKITGRLEHLAAGERIYSARFLGERCYLVTFKQTDPLFVLDLSEPTTPVVLGELKIPGFSNYLHPYDENHLLGFGQDTEETNSGVITKGMKVAMFDVTDVAKPSQMHSLTIGGRGTYSPLLYDHKALLFDKSTGLLAFPITEMSQNTGQDWGIPVFQGAYVYKVSLAEGFQKQAAISHGQNTENSGWGYDIQRLLTIGDQLYSFSNARLQANALTGFQQTGYVDFPVAQLPFVPVMGMGGAMID